MPLAALVAEVGQLSVLIKGYVKKCLLHQHHQDATASEYAASLSSFHHALIRSDVSLSRAFSRIGLVPAQETPNQSSTSAPVVQATCKVQTVTQADTSIEPLLGSDGYLRRCLIWVLAHSSHAFMHGLNTTEVVGGERLSAALQRPHGTPLITVSNHVAAMDDPLVLSTVVPQELYGRPETIRWTLCASDRCFKYAALSPLFTAAKVLPIQRGGGLSQPGMRAAEARLAAGDWVHVFPEGTRSQGGGRMGAVRKGVGRLVSACRDARGRGSPDPLVLPFVHEGMEGVMPRGRTLPSTGQRVRVLVGAPVPVGDLLDAAEKQRWTDDRLHMEVAGRVGHHLHALKSALAAEVATVGADAALPDDARQRLLALGVGSWSSHDSSGVSGSASASDPSSSSHWSSSDGIPGGPSPAVGVSGLDLFDEADVRWHHRASVWEKAAFRMAHRAWSLDGARPRLLQSRPSSAEAQSRQANAATAQALGQRQPHSFGVLSTALEAYAVAKVQRLSARLESGWQWLEGGAGSGEVPEPGGSPAGTTDGAGTGMASPSAAEGGDGCDHQWSSRAAAHGCDDAAGADSGSGSSGGGCSRPLAALLAALGLPQQHEYAGSVGGGGVVHTPASLALCALGGCSSGVWGGAFGTPSASGMLRPLRAYATSRTQSMAHMVHGGEARAAAV
ncbi:hypothetical protein FOA52_010479 [Chlamydomonas sp. UWO 241]|nr:hypothetical protein FOA52_010479 [Chlamydomonas sp. UWO 241]